MTSLTLWRDVSSFQSTVLGNSFPAQTSLSKDLKEQTLVRLREETEEFEDADTIADQADAAIDLIYFGLGALRQMGFDLSEHRFEARSDLLRVPPASPRKLTGKLLRWRLGMLEDQLNNLYEATGPNSAKTPILAMIDIALEMLYLMGVDVQRVWDEVHRCNMLKVKGVTHRGDDNDASKPEGWNSPDHSWLDEAAQQNQSGDEEDGNLQTA